jgi:cation transport regulator ChaB
MGVTPMPYVNSRDPLPSFCAHAPDISRAAFHHALVEDEGEEAAFRVACSTVGRGYQKGASVWVRKLEAS